MTQVYEIRFEASGEVRDADGNLIEQVPIDQTVTVTEEQAKAMGLIEENVDGE